MFFNLVSGETDLVGHGMECWVADGNFWIAGNGCETSIHQLKFEEFTALLEKTSSSQEYLEMNDTDGFHICLEDEDEETRNLCFMGNRMFFCINLQVKVLPKLAKFLREQV